MAAERDYGKDIAEIRTMMERSSRFMSLSGLAGVMAGIYALAGAWVVHSVYDFNPDALFYTATGPGSMYADMPKVAFVALLVMILAVSTAIFLSYRKAKRREETFWNATSRRLVANMAVPLAAGGVLAVILYAKGVIGLIAPVTLLFYGLALYTASKFTYDDVRVLGLIQIALGLAACWFVAYSLLIWAVGFGAVHILYGSYMYLRYER
ncbi:MAG: hypothetical protein U5K31_10605 [Balneolaceae bacterium]|nr:hypothetical protein [Balneolaceae bacterium]